MATLISQNKLLGSFYTPPAVANVLTQWAVKNDAEAILDPACGDGVFLRAASEMAHTRFVNLRIVGIDLNEEAINGSKSIPRTTVKHGDFFTFTASKEGLFDAVVGNPPYIRYQAFKGASRAIALRAARRAGVELSELSSSWAPFLIHSATFLKHGGRLAMVIPTEITHAGYSRAVVKFLTANFRQITLVICRDRLFPQLNQDTVLLFADGFGEMCVDFRLKRIERVEELESFEARVGNPLSIRDLNLKDSRLRSHLFSPEAAAIYESIKQIPGVFRLGEVSKVGIGFVTGANGYFLISAPQADELRIPSEFLRPVVTSQQSIGGLSFSESDWGNTRDSGNVCFLLALPKIDIKRLPKPIRDYLHSGIRAKVHEGYKCRVREPWYSVPHGEAADAFLTYMSGLAPAVSWNSASVLATNTLHELRLDRLYSKRPWILAASFLSTFTELSCEIEGHPMGGGMLKLEPSEAASVHVALPSSSSFTKSYFNECDRLLRLDRREDARELVDRYLLRDFLGVSTLDIRKLRGALNELRATRKKVTASRIK